MPCADPYAVKALSKELGRKINKIWIPKGLGTAIGVAGIGMGSMPSMPLDGSMTTILFREWGTPSNTPLAITSGDGPLKNWGAGPKEVGGLRLTLDYDPEKINRIEEAKYHCYSCPLGCGGRLDLSGVKYSEYYETHKPEYETLQAFGPLCVNRDLGSVLYMNELLNRAGMDSISAGNTVA
jgi:aldehyde:ferredoxin oxidoreductase